MKTFFNIGSNLREVLSILYVTFIFFVFLFDVFFTFHRHLFPPSVKYFYTKSIRKGMSGIRFGRMEEYCFVRFVTKKCKCFFCYQHSSKYGAVVIFTFLLSSLSSTPTNSSILPSYFHNNHNNELFTQLITS